MNEYVKLITPLDIAGVAVSLFALIVIMGLLELKKKQELQLGILQALIQQFKPRLGLEKNLDIVLEELEKLVEAPTFCFYIYNPSNQHYTLKAVRQVTSDARIAPSYSGLLPYQKETYVPPLSLLQDSVPLKVSTVVEGEVPLLAIPIKGEKGFIRIGPLKKVGRKKLKMLTQLGFLLEVPITNLLEEEDQRRNYEVLETSSKAVKFINHLFIHEVEYLKLIVSNCVKSIQPLQCFMLESSPTTQRIPYSYGIGKQKQLSLSAKRTIPNVLKEALGKKSFTLIQSSHPSFSQLKGLLRITVDDYVIMVQFTLFQKEYFILFAFGRGSRDEELHRSQSIQSMFNVIQKYLSIKHASKKVSVSYIDLLKNLADMIDQRSPFTVGYSELMSKYSMLIANRLGLSEFHVRSIGLAAYLSNIGVIGLSDGLLTKEGKYSEHEFEQMKLHSEVGAAIIENTIALDDVAKYVRYHHERIDGNGYPSGLVGNEIPVGSQIIAVIQTFLAKIIGRSYRNPLPFDDALKILTNASGTHLNEEIVNVFISWYSERRMNKKGLNVALGNCWELCCTPSMICNKCPVYEKGEKNCWEHEKNNCRAHGKSCSTCFVYTEFLGRRTEQLVGKGE